MTNGIRDMIRNRKAVYETDKKKRTDRWKKLKKLTNSMIKSKKREFVDSLKQRAIDEGNSSQFYKAVKCLKDHDKPPEWDVRGIFPNLTDKQVADKIAVFFNKISQEFESISDLNITEPIRWSLSHEQVSDMLRSAKKPKSRVKCDIFPDLINESAEVLAVPLTKIYNKTIESGIWPAVWKEETVVVIPKCKSPESLSQCRNLSCTPFFSKCLERFVFARINEETTLSNAQFGGRKKCGVDHMLVDMWETILSDIDTPSSASCLVSLDFEKAFNRLNHDSCIKALKDHNASTTSIKLVHAFLSGRRIRARVGTTLSDALDIKGGSPQGPILGNLLFTLTTDDLTSTIEYHGTDLNAGFEQGSIVQVDTNLARITSPENSDYGINNITVISDISELSAPFHANGSITGEGTFGSLPDPTPFTTSSPTSRGQFAQFIPPGNIVNTCLDETYSSTSGLTFVYMQGVRKAAIINDTSEECLSALNLSASNQELRISYTEPAGWREREKIIPYVYIDDTNGIERLSTNAGVKSISDRRQTTMIHARDSETFFNEIEMRSTLLGMKINAQKTQLLCISGAGQAARSFVRLGGEKIVSTDNLKICGFTFGAKPNVDEQIAVIERKFHTRSWVLRNLKRSGFTHEELVLVYVSLVRPIFDYTSVVYHSLLTNSQSKLLESLQKYALRIIYNYTLEYHTLLEKSGLTTLHDRRLALIDGFIQKNKSGRFAERWFPHKFRNIYGTRHEEKYAENKANTERMRNSPLNFYRRRLNQMNESCSESN